MSNKNRNTRPSWAWVDFTFILVITILLICGLLARSITEEYATKINMYERKMTGQQSEKNGIDTPVLTVGVTDGGGQIFVLSSKAIGRREFESVSDVKSALNTYSFALLKLKIDRAIPTGITQALLMDAQEMGIQATLSVKRKG